jgi:hypothetical protein
MDEETQSKVKADNEEARKLREKMADELAHKFSCFKRDFMGAPIWRALKSLKAGNHFPSKPTEPHYRRGKTRRLMRDQLQG